MRKFYLILALAAALAVTDGVTAEAAEGATLMQVTGSPAFDRSSRTLWLNGRDAYYVPENLNTIRLWNADRVTLSWIQEGERRVVQRYSVESDDSD